MSEMSWQDAYPTRLTVTAAIQHAQKIAEEQQQNRQLFLQDAIDNPPTLVVPPELQQVDLHSEEYSTVAERWRLYATRPSSDRYAIFKVQVSDRKTRFECHRRTLPASVSAHIEVSLRV